VGIDVVDLDDPRAAGKGGDPRFAARVLAPRERAFVAAADDPDLALWSLWAAKEAAFKVVSSMAGRAPVFRHAAFEVEAEALPIDEGPLVAARVAYEGASVSVVLTLRHGCVIGLGWGPEGGLTVPSDVHWRAVGLGPLANELDAEGRPLDELRLDCFAPAEGRAVHSLPSALVRLGARRDAAFMPQRDESEVAVVCGEGPAGRMPPTLHLAGRPAPGVAVSLSHHGRWAAWALRNASPDPLPQRRMGR
jgi:phosphopantetheinyl transferase (holo-ACP synthase)